MDVVYQIIRQSAIGPYGPGVRGSVLLVFLAIVTTLLAMLITLLVHGHQVPISFGY